ncbi:cellulose synthase/poly-beta-1,6-N-acetylglucosamine synthase-like glycosyltransferase [Mucilaginibacter oryzae]|uniref:Cellulose synthase/poly-beta-1,6-N-acetylglucosamine synthase-like glycosyltransferase n=1 Tax=Mucilaginibacter oryzae TaxID=468058 RepID=A0A316GS63_9SPHI|nr:glycosyltransferase family 2 protein [Mucilaginibacter oryzae]PWK65255.1 cellulose synthase/poly-beta-1,6-N-acetylglucosamine synthase-like glycosyltransferase [Mucilaginibacter oryzae]
MIRKLKSNNVNLKWITDSPGAGKKAALLIPQYNEASQNNIYARLEYFKQLSTQIKADIDLIIIDDGSTDNSLDEIRSFLNSTPCDFTVASVYPNANKVGALYMTVLEIEHEFIILSDFDTDLDGFEFLSKELSRLGARADFMGGYFRMLPLADGGGVTLFQQVEYAMARSLYRFHRNEDSVPVMPGAGSCYKRNVLVRIFEDHSGLRSGEDRESTLIGLKNGFKTAYIKDVIALTRPPRTIRTLIKQRVRWNLGYLETIDKEKQFYKKQVAESTRIGLRFFIDMLTVILLILLPFALLTLISIAPNYFWISILAIYGTGLLWCLAVVVLVPEETMEFQRKRHLSVLIFPFYKILVEYMSWNLALSQFFSNKKNNHAG